MTKKLAASPEAAQTETTGDNRHDGYDCQPRSIKTRPAAERGGKKDHFYKPLTTQFRHDGFNYRQIAREGDVAIYEQRWIRPNGELSENVAYEVIRIRRREAFQIAGKVVEPAEIYPRSEAWGTDGFTLIDRDAAFNKLRQIVAGRTGKNQLEQDGDVLEQEQTETQTETKHKLELKAG